MKIKKAPFILSAIFLLASQSGLAKSTPTTTLEENQKNSKNVAHHNTETTIAKEKNFDAMGHGISYLPYMQVGGARFLNVDSSKWAAGVDLFIPLWQAAPSHLVFTDARFYDRTGKPFEGNIHVGYRYLSKDETRLHGVYGAFDRKRTAFGNYFNQLTLGIENWFERLFVGANFYQPIGARLKYTGFTEIFELGDVNKGMYIENVLVTPDYRGEKAMGGSDAEVGYEIIKGLTAYAGGYYFKATDMPTVFGPKARLTYDYSLNDGKRILGVFDKLGLETGIQRDKPRGTVGYVGLNFRVGMAPHKSSSLQGVSRHMTDLVRRDIDVVTAEGFVGKGIPEIAIVKDKAGKKVKIVDLGRITAAELKKILSDSNATISLRGEAGNISDEVKEVIKNNSTNNNIVNGDEIRFFSPHTGRDISAGVRPMLGNLLDTEQMRQQPKSIGMQSQPLAPNGKENKENKENTDNGEQQQQSMGVGSQTQDQTPPLETNREEKRDEPKKDEAQIGGTQPQSSPKGEERQDEHHKDGQPADVGESPAQPQAQQQSQAQTPPLATNGEENSGEHKDGQPAAQPQSPQPGCQSIKNQREYNTCIVGLSAGSSEFEKISSQYPKFHAKWKKQQAGKTGANFEGLGG